MEAQNIAPPAAVPARPAESVNGPIARFSFDGDDWLAWFSFADPVLAISWRLGDSGEYHETGLYDEFDTRTRKRMPKSYIKFPGDTPDSIINVRYVDTAGVTQGPFPIRFDPVALMIKVGREDLEQYATNWLEFEEDGSGLDIFYGNLVSSRCTISEARVGIDSMVPDQVLEIAPCDYKHPLGVIGTRRLRLPPKTRMVSVKLSYRDGKVSGIRVFRRQAEPR